jgi:uroporphyrinogen decarboxylase
MNRSVGYEQGQKTVTRFANICLKMEKKLNSRLRFLTTMGDRNPDRAPLFQEGIRTEVLDSWRAEGLPAKVDLAQVFIFDKREEFEVDLEPRPYPSSWPSTKAELIEFQRRLDAHDPPRLPRDWPKRVREWRDRDHILMMKVHEGLLLTMGVGDWRRFDELMLQLGENPNIVGELMARYGEFAALLIDRVLKEVEIDAAIFSEPIGGDTGPLISPRMYADLVLPSYQPILEVLANNRVETIILRTYANTRVLLPSLIELGINCVWAVEGPLAMDYRELREEFGSKVGLIGGIDLDALRGGQKSIQREVLAKVPSLLAEGGYIPLADGRVRSEISFENYSYYRHLLEEIVLGWNH